MVVVPYKPKKTKQEVPLIQDYGTLLLILIQMENTVCTCLNL